MKEIFKRILQFLILLVVLFIGLYFYLSYKENYREFNLGQPVIINSLKERLSNYLPSFLKSKTENQIKKGLVGGVCEYDIYKGVCKISSVEEFRQKDFPGVKSFKVSYFFEFDNPKAIKQEWFKPNKELLDLDFYITEACLQAHGIEPDTVMNCTVDIIKKGTCTPVAYSLDGIDRNDCSYSNSTSTDDWKVFTDEKGGYSIKYPSDWKPSENKQENGISSVYFYKTEDGQTISVNSSINTAGLETIDNDFRELSKRAKLGGIDEEKTVFGAGNIITVFKEKNSDGGRYTWFINKKDGLIEIVANYKYPNKEEIVMNIYRNMVKATLELK